LHARILKRFINFTIAIFSDTISSVLWEEKRTRWPCGVSLVTFVSVSSNAIQTPLHARILKCFINFSIAIFRIGFLLFCEKKKYENESKWIIELKFPPKVLQKFSKWFLRFSRKFKILQSKRHSDRNLWKFAKLRQNSMKMLLTNCSICCPERNLAHMRWISQKKCKGREK
jgi:hypothetical protein